MRVFWHTRMVSTNVVTKHSSSKGQSFSISPFKKIQNLKANKILKQAEVALVRLEVVWNTNIVLQEAQISLFSYFPIGSRDQCSADYAIFLNVLR